MKISGKTEFYLSVAVSLNQNGNMKNIILGKNNILYILNMDSTILLRFKILENFSQSFSFYANDYESDTFNVKNNQIIFLSKNENYKRTKICSSPKIKFEEINDVWNKYNPSKDIKLIFNSDIISLLDNDLSHIELSKKKNENFKLIQKDIYSGSRIELTKNDKRNTLFVNNGDFKIDPIGIRTMDFQSLFIFNNDVTFFIQENENWMYVESDDFKGILSTCIYDELSYIGE